jgi:hypothetical protein
MMTRPRKQKRKKPLRIPLEESTMFLWDWCLDSDEEHIEDIFPWGIHKSQKLHPKITTYATKGQYPTLLYPKKLSLPLGK